MLEMTETHDAQNIHFEIVTKKQFEHTANIDFLLRKLSNLV